MWEIEQEGVVTQDASTLIFNYTMAGTYKVKIVDECGFSYEKEIELFCSGDEIDCPFSEEFGYALDYLYFKSYNYIIEDNCDNQHNLIFHVNLDVYNSCVYDCPWIGNLIKFSDGGVYIINKNEDGLYELETIVESENVVIDEQYHYIYYYGDTDETHTIEIALSTGCLLKGKVDKRTDDEESDVWFAGLDIIDGICAQAMNVKCKTCKTTISYPEEFMSDFSVCNDPVSVPFLFLPDLAPGWTINSGISPFEYGGNYGMQLGSDGFNNINIPAGTPYMYVSAEDGHPSHVGPDWIRCIYAAGYASSPAYLDKPIYVAYSEDFINSQTIYTFEPPSTIIDPDCDEEWVTTSVEFCKKDVICLDNNQSTVIGTIVDESSLIPCKLQTPEGCIVVGFCTDSNDYYYDDEGGYFVFEDLDCDDDEVMDCVEDTNNEPPIVCDEDHPCPDGEFCKFNICRDCPTFTYTGLYGNNYDCV
ncbi:MAG: hypothetical protein ACJATI_002676, partial [Halioglobus sp.]